MNAEENERTLEINKHPLQLSQAKMKRIDVVQLNK